MAQYITLGFNILLLVLVLFGFLWGLIRGLKKTAGRGIFLLILSICLIFLSVPITNLILKIGVNLDLTINDFQLIGNYNISEMITKVMEYYIGSDFIAKYPDFSQVLVSFSIIFINAIVYLVLFWLLKYLLLPLNVLLTKLIFPTRRRKTEAMGFAANTEGEEPVQINETESTPTETEVKVQATQIEKMPTKKKKKEKVKVKKRRLLGGLVGVAVGLIVTFNTMVPLYGILEILETTREIKLNNIAEEPIDVNDMTEGYLTEISDAYKASIMNTLSQYTGLKALGVTSFDKVTTVSIDERNVTLRKDIDAIVETILQADNLLGKYNTYSSEEGLKSITQEQLTDLLAETRTLLDKCQNIQIVDCISDYVLPIACSYVIKSNPKLTKSNLVNDMIKDTLVTIINTSGINVIDELYKLLDIADYVSDKGLLLKILHGETDKPISITHTLSNDFTTNLLEKVYNLQTVDTTLTHIFNIGLTYFDEMTDFGYSEQEITKNDLKSKLSTLVNDAFLVAKTMSDDSSTLVTLDSIRPLGKFLDTVKTSGLINEETYTNVISYATTKLKQITGSIVPEKYVDIFNNQILNNINLVEDWQLEMNTIASSIDQLRAKEGGIIGSVSEDSDLRVGSEIKIELDEPTINNLGIALDTLEKTVIFGTKLTQQVYENGTHYNGTTITKLLSLICDEAKGMITDDSEDSSLQGFTEVIDSIRTNIISCNHTYNSENPHFYENEFKSISPLVVELNNILSAGETELTENLGVNLDRAKSGILFGNKTTLILIREAMGLVSDQVLGTGFEYNADESTQDTNDKIYQLFNDIQAELDTVIVANKCKSEVDFWQTEMKSYMALKDIADDASSIDTIDSMLPLAEKLDIAYSPECDTIPKESLNAVIAHTIRQAKTSVTADTSDLDKAINDAIESIAGNIEAEDFNNPAKDYNDYWQIELNHISELNNIEYTKVEDNPETPDIDESTTYGDIGMTLDKVTLGYTTDGNNTTLGYDELNENSTRPSYLITHNTVRNILEAGVGEMSTTISDSFDAGTIRNAINVALADIKSNIGDTTNIPLISFTNELTYLDRLSSIEVNSNIFDSNQSASLQRVGSTLDGIAYKTVDNITSTPNTRTYDSDNSLVITRDILSTLVRDLLPIAKSTDGNTATDATVDSIANKITDIKSSDKVISWEREFGFVSSVMSLKDAEINDSSYNALGETIDAIAFRKNASAYSDIIYTADFAINLSATGDLNKANSLLIDRTTLNTHIASIIESSTVTGGANATVINNTLNSIANSISSHNEDIFSWKYELSKINTLKNLNDSAIISSDLDLPSETTVGSNGEIVYSDGVVIGRDGKITKPENYTGTFVTPTLIQLALNLDKLSFNLNSESTDYNDIIFDNHIPTNYDETKMDTFNSVIITRTIMKNLVAGIIGDSKDIEETDVDLREIIGNIVDATTSKVNEGENLDTSNYYSTFAESFTALLRTKKRITTADNDFDNVNLQSLTEDSAKSADKLLSDLQNELICGIVTTRKVTKLILSNINASMSDLYFQAGLSFENTTTGKYIAGLITHFGDSSKLGERVDYSNESAGYNMTTDGQELDEDTYSNLSTSNPITTIKTKYISSLI